MLENQYNNRRRDCFNGYFQNQMRYCINRNGLFEYGKSATYYKTGTFGGFSFKFFMSNKGNQLSMNWKKCNCSYL